MKKEEKRRTPNAEKNTPRQEKGAKVGDELRKISPGFRSVAAMAGWDEESLMVATLVVEDTPDQNHSKSSKHIRIISPLSSSSSSSSSIRKRRRLLTVTSFNLDLDLEPTPDRYSEPDHVSRPKSCQFPTSLDRVREELSCAICLEICFEPSTTSCGHSFCKGCLRSTVERCGKRCPKCRKFFSNGRSYTVNTVLWNTIQLLFPEEVEMRKKEAVSTTNVIPEAGTETRKNGVRRRDLDARFLREMSRAMVQDGEAARQDPDTALAMRLQREELMVSFRNGPFSHRSRISAARSNLRTMASALRLRARNS